jgi:uncharacterized membrane protein YjjB (DUF3815 family)
MTVPVYAVAFLAILFFCFFSHKINARGPAIAIAGLIGVIGYIVILATKTPGSRYAGVFIAVIGIYAANGELFSLSLSLSLMFEFPPVLIELPVVQLFFSLGLARTFLLKRNEQQVPECKSS